MDYTPAWPARHPRRRSALVLGWVIFRLVQFPPFVEFLIATEAEMNKVSWTSKDDLYRATTVVLTTVLLMAVFLFGVDWLWSILPSSSASSSSAAGAVRLDRLSSTGSPRDRRPGSVPAVRASQRRPRLALSDLFDASASS